jgi:hypothetical protein
MSFFSFQDIVSCVTGILIMVTLLLIVELAKRPQTIGRNSQATVPDWVVLAEELKAAQKKRDDLTAALEQAQATLTRDARRLTLTPTIVKDLEKQVNALRKTCEEQILNGKKTQTEQDRIAQQITEAQSARNMLADRARQLEQQIALEHTKIRVTLLGGRPDGKKPYLVELDPKDIGVAEISPSGEVRQIKRFTGEDVAGVFTQWAESRSNITEYFVFLVRPEGAALLNDITGSLKKSDFDLGWDVWPKERSLVSGETRGN